EEIEERNRQVNDLRRTLDHYEALAAKTQQIAAGYKARLITLARRLAGSTVEGGTTHATREYYPAVDMPTQLYRAQEDGYLDLRLARNFHLLFDVCQAISKELERRAGCNSRGEAAAQEAFYHLKNHLLWSYDLDYHRRQYHYLHQVVRGLFKQLQQGNLFS